jgi:predicted ribosomally synthesized peptide with nif11-like leader
MTLLADSDEKPFDGPAGIFCWFCTNRNVHSASFSYIQEQSGCLSGASPAIKTPPTQRGTTLARRKAQSLRDFFSRKERPMSIESAIAYIRRMREDDAFRRAMNEFDGSDAAWRQLEAQGFTFSMEEFRKAQEVIYKEYGVTPL